MDFQLTTTASPWFILVCLAVGAAYAYLLYRGRPAWGPRLNRALAACRFVLVAGLCFLLLGPLVRQLLRTYEKPAVVLAVDDSQSVRLATDSASLQGYLGRLEAMAAALRRRGIEVDVQLLSGPAPAGRPPAPGGFNRPATNLSQLLGTVQANYENRNLAGVVLLSDGIYNQGLSPEYQPYNFPIYPVALGDTVPRRDLNLKVLYFNKITYLGNRFPVVAELHSTGFAGRVVTVQLKQDGRVLASQTVPVAGNADIQEVTFYAEAKAKGIQHYVVEVAALPEEFTRQNNARDAYIEVVDGKEKILLLAAAPHPDIKALKSALDKNENYDLEVVVAGQAVPKQARYDLVVLHQIPDLAGAGTALARPFLEQKAAAWFILGSQSNLQQFSNANPVVKIVSRGTQTDQVFPVFNPAFTAFTFAEANAALLPKLPPATVPFADYRLLPNAEVLLQQRVGSVATDKPLWVIGTTPGRKTAVLLGEGLWEWRMEEYNLTENQAAVDELVGKTVQYLSAKDDKRKLRVYPVADEFLDTEPVVFEAETYNDIYEKTYNQKIDLQITPAGGRPVAHAFTTAEGNSRFELSRLPKGVYRYKASTVLKGRTEQATGEFVVRDQSLEALATTADHNLLRKLAAQTNGRFYHAAQIDELARRLTENPLPDRVRSQEQTVEVIHLKWLFFVLLLLATAEWAVRKYQGAY